MAGRAYPTEPLLGQALKDALWDMLSSPLRIIPRELDPVPQPSEGASSIDGWEALGVALPWAEDLTVGLTNATAKYGLRSP